MRHKHKTLPQVVAHRPGANAIGAASSVWHIGASHIPVSDQATMQYDAERKIGLDSNSTGSATPRFIAGRSASLRDAARRRPELAIAGNLEAIVHQYVAEASAAPP